MFNLPSDILAWADAFNNFHGIVAILMGSIWLVTSRVRRREAVALLSDTVGLVSSKPVVSTFILCGFLAPVAVAVAYTDQTQNQVFLEMAGFLTGLWIWYVFHPHLDRTEGRLLAVSFIAIFVLAFGCIAYLPNVQVVS